MIGEMNRRITFRSWGSDQDEGGGAIPLLLTTYTIWAKVEARNGQMFSGKQQTLWTYDYKITFRYEKSRLVASNFTIDYDGKRLAINSLSFINEGNRKYAIARCSTTDANINTDNDIFTTIGVFDYYGIGDEDEFIAASTTTPIGSPPTVPTDLRGKTIVGAYKDGIEFNVLLAGPFTDPSIKQVIYNSASGSFLWSVPYEPLEHTLIQYLEPCGDSGITGEDGDEIILE